MIRKYNGKDLAKVLIYYDLIMDVETTKFNICCPFHEDPKPSMMICLDDASFYCFGCNLGGDVIDFIHYVHPELNDLQCCLKLERILKSDKVEHIKVNVKKKHRISYKQTLNEAEDYYYGLSVTDWYNIQTPEEQKVFDYMFERGFDARALTLGKCKASFDVAYPILFPILDNGVFMGYVARTMNKYVERRQKYNYNFGFRKRDTLCGTYRQNKVVYLCEGFLDYLSLWTKGRVRDVCAILGWHISDNQVKKLKDKGITTVVSALDTDDAGVKGTEYLKKFFNVIRFQFPDGVKDTGEMTEQQIKKAVRKTERLIKCN